MSKKIYLELDEREGRLFEFSKESKEGFSKHTYSTGKESYRKNHDKGLVGKLKFISEFENDFGKGKFKVCVITVEDVNGDQVSMKLPILTSKGGLNEYFEQLATYLPNLEIGETYRIFPYSMETTYKAKDGTDKPTTNRGFSISTYDMENDEKLIKVERAHTYGEEGDIPKIVWNEVKDMGVVKNVKDDKDRRNFLYDSFKSVVDSNSTSTETKPEAEKKPVAAATFNEEGDEHDDLPF